MKLILKNTSIKMEYHSLTWNEYEFDVANRNHFFINGTPTWIGEGYSYFITRTSEMDKLRVKAKTDKNAGIAFLTGTSHSTGTTPSFCEGTGRISVPMGTTQTFDIPSDCNYIYVYSGPETPSGSEDANLPLSVKTGFYDTNV